MKMIYEKIAATVMMSVLIAGVVIALSGCTQAQEQRAASIAKTALTAAQAACQGASQARNLAASVAKGGAADTVATISSYVDATCNATALASAVAKDPATAAWINGLGTALQAAAVAAPAPAAP